MKYTELTFTELVNKIGNSRFFDLPKMLEEAFKKVQTLIDNIPSGGGGSELPYKVYTALLTQSGTDAPVATVLENTLGGDVVWSRNGVGDYNALLPEEYTLEKITIPLGTYYNSVTGLVTSTEVVDSQNIRVISQEEILASTGTDLTALDNFLFNSFIEIRVYS